MESLPLLFGLATAALLGAVTDALGQPIPGLATSTSTLSNPNTESQTQGEIREDGFDEERSFLEAIRSDLASGSSQLGLRGFADANYRVPLIDEMGTWEGIVPTFPAFFVGSVNLYLYAQLFESWRMMLEFRFLYAPAGHLNNMNGLQTDIVDTTTEDISSFGSLVQPTGLSIERAWIEYEFSSLLAFRVGQWLTPYGIWNIDRASPLVVTTQVPFLVRQEFFPKYQSGIEAHGTVPFDWVGIGYHVYVSNGRNPFARFQDLDSNPGLGGRLFLSGSWLGELTVGFSAYLGRVTFRRFEIDSGNMGEANYPVTNQYNELSLGADLRWECGGLLVQFEWLHNQFAFTDRGRVQTRLGAPGLIPDGNRWGVYALLGYRIPGLKLMPYVLFEDAVPAEYDPRLRLKLPEELAYSIGLNWEPVPQIVFKLELTSATFSESALIFFSEDLTFLQTQLAWAF